MAEQPSMILIRCPICEQELVGVVDIPMIRQLELTCPHCLDLAVSIMLERTQPANPHGVPVVGDPEHWRLVGVAAEAPHTPQCVVGHRRQSRRQARRRHNRH